MGFLEYFLVTPSHHRVHHAINPEYLDKNYGQVFILWDRWFGTFQEELPASPPVYGVTIPVRTWNPIKINFQHLWLLIQDAWHTRNWGDKFRIWFKPTGWRPADVIEQYPVEYIKDVYHFDKYDTSASSALVAWSWIQMFFNYFLLVYFFANLANIGSPGIFYYGGFLFLAIFAYTELMDRNPYAVYFEALKSALGLYLIYQARGDWFGATQHWGAWVVYLVGAYFVLSVLMTVLFVEREIKLKQV
jgi:hypothetical protein